MSLHTQRQVLVVYFAILMVQSFKDLAHSQALVVYRAILVAHILALVVFRVAVVVYKEV